MQTSPEDRPPATPAPAGATLRAFCEDLLCADLRIAPDLARIGFLDWTKHAVKIADGLQAARDRLAALDAATAEGFR